MDSSDSVGVGVGVINVDLDTSTYLLLTVDLEDSEFEEADNASVSCCTEQLDLYWNLDCSYDVQGHHHYQHCPQADLCLHHQTDHADPLHHLTSWEHLSPHSYFLVQLKL